MRSFPELLKIERGIALDFDQIKALAVGVDLGMRDHEDLPEHPTLKDVVGNHDAVCVLLHVLGPRGSVGSVGHWVLVIQRPRLAFFDPLGKPLSHLYSITSEPPKLVHAFKGHKFEFSSVALQRSVKGVRSCGCHCAVRAVFRSWRTRDYEKFIQSHYGTPDDTVETMCTLNILSKKTLAGPELKAYLL